MLSATRNWFTIVGLILYSFYSSLGWNEHFKFKLKYLCIEFESKWLKTLHVCQLHITRLVWKYRPPWVLPLTNNALHWPTKSDEQLQLNRGCCFLVQAMLPEGFPFHQLSKQASAFPCCSHWNRVRSVFDSRNW